MNRLLLALFFAAVLPAATIPAIPGTQQFFYENSQFEVYFSQPFEQSDVMDGYIALSGPSPMWFIASDDLLTVQLNALSQPIQYFEAHDGGMFTLRGQPELLNEPPRPAETPEPSAVLMIGVGMVLIMAGRKT